MRVRLMVLAASVLLLPQPAHAAADVVPYECTTAAGETQNIKVTIELTVPTDAIVGVEMAIGWQGSYVTGSELKAPATGLDGEINLYAYAGISGYPGLTSATGVAPVGTITPGGPIPLPATPVQLKTKANSEDQGTVHAAAINFGPTPQQPLIECEISDGAALTEHPLTVPGTGGPADPDPADPDPAASESPDPEPTPTITQTPEGGVQTGGGGEAGPDGRMVMLTGSMLILVSTTGLALHRRRRPPH
ncbi:hypothetical protein [Nonomuraea sp. NPDC002799]